MPMNDMQYLAAYGDFDKDVLVSAGAGSGKTQVLTSRVTNLIEKGVKPTELLVLTFTNAAAAEMKSRVRGMLSERQDLRDSISLLEQAYITTFDSFNLSMCKKYFYALNVSPNIGICDASSMKIKKIEIIDDILNELYEAHDDALEDYLNNFTDKRDDILKDNLLILINGLDKLDDSLDYLKHYDEKFFSDDFFVKIKDDYLKLCLNYKEKAVKILEDLMSSTDSVKSHKQIQEIIDIYLKNNYEGIKEAALMSLPRKGKNDDESFSLLKLKLKKEVQDPLSSLTRYESLDDAINKYLLSKKSINLFINILIMKGDLPMGAPMKNSRQRNAILECVMRHHDHPTADIIYQELRESFPNISLGTVYRNLSLLTSLGKILKITCENHADRFDGQTKPHAHFECKSCGCLQDIPFKPSIHPQEEIGAGFDGIISDYTITFRGYCAKCAKNSD